MALFSIRSADSDLLIRWSTGASAYLGRGDLQLQTTDKSCGPASLKYLLHLLGQEVSEATIAELAGTGPHGTTLLGLVGAAEHFGYFVEAWKLGS